jgi:hypothetical protein
MLFPKRVDFTPSQTHTIGSTVRFEITREFHIDSIYIVVKATPSAGSATNNPDAFPNLLNRVQLTVSDGAQNRNIVDVAGVSLLELANQWIGGLDRNTAALVGANPSSGAKTMVYPIFFSHPQLADPIGSVLLLPAPRFNSNPVLSLTFSTQAQMDTNATPTFAYGSGSVYLVINRRQVNRPDFPTFNTELAEIQTAYGSTGNAQLQEIQIPGSYTGILLKDYTDTTSATGRGSIQVANGENRLQLLGTVLRRFRVEDIQNENDYSVRLYPATWSQFAGSFYLDFLSDKNGEVAGDLGSVLDGNILQASGSRIQLLQDITGGSNVVRKYVTHRIFGNLQKLKF